MKLKVVMEVSKDTTCNARVVVRMSAVCLICNEKASKYKCSTCFWQYCSLDCWKKHKDGDNCTAKKSVDNCLAVISDQKKYFTEDTIDNDKLSQLSASKVLKAILKNKYLQNILITVDNATNSEETIQKAMKIPEFVEFVDECLKIVECVND